MLDANNNNNKIEELIDRVLRSKERKSAEHMAQSWFICISPFTLSETPKSQKHSTNTANSSLIP